MHAEMERLKELTIKQEADFSQAANYFLNHMAENARFLKEGKALKSKTAFYAQLLTPVAERFHVKLDANTLLLLRLKKYRFIHGAGLLPQNKSLAFYFFEDIQVGLAIVSALDGVTDFFRLTLLSTEKPILLPAASVPSQAVH